eukprot:m.59787 g.59787  ORF g.59787 m.59787 type:complete len:408 (+) comp9478_c0_seq1:76-1299(+)
MLMIGLLAVLLVDEATADSGVGGVKFRNTAHRVMKLYWRSHTGVPDYAGRVHADGATTGFQTYAGHTFFWAEDNADPPVPTTAAGAKNVEFSIREDQRVYVFEDDSTLPEVKEALEKELTWMREYKERTGREWVGTTWPRPPPTYDMWDPKEVGQRIFVPLYEHPTAGQYHCDHGGNLSDCLAADGRHLKPEQAYQTPLEGLTIEVVSVQPKAFRIENFLSEFETDYIIQQAAPRLGRSTVGHGEDARDSGTRTSKSAWLHRGHSEVLEAIYTRVGIVTKVPSAAVEEANVESLNVLNYPKGAEYTPHYDWGADGKVSSRFISSLLYLNTPEAGGSTSFPKAIMPDGSVGTEIPAVKRSLAFFYDLLEDGNGDELSLHAGTPVLEGEKWIAPLWIWEPLKAKWTNKV